jgi:hypothetical protein
MPKKDMDYSKMVIYKICCKDLNITDIYIGHTTSLVKRRCSHKSNYNNETSKEYNKMVYQFIRNNGGWENWEVIEIEKCPCLDFEEACKIERFYIETLNATLNRVIPSRTLKEWYEVNKDAKAEYYKNNIDSIKEKHKLHREKNRDIINEKAKGKLRYEPNKDLWCSQKREKVKCDCGCVIARGNLPEHKRTQKHIKLIEQVNLSS